MADESEKSSKKKKAGRPKKTTHSSGLLRKRVTIGHDKNGKPINPPIYAKTQAEFEEKVGLARMQAGMGVAITDRKSTWQYWAQVWLKLKMPDVGPGQLKNYKTAVNKHLSPLNNKKMKQVTSLDLLSITNQMYVDGYAKRSISFVIDAARQICKLARKNHAMMADIAEDVKANKSAPVTEREPVTPEEEKMIWNVKPLPAKTKEDARRAARLPLARMLALMILNCGPRKEEVVVLGWKAVDLGSASIKIKNAYDFKGKRIKGPKSKAGYRSVPIPDEYCEELKKWKEKNKGTLLGRTWVFPGNHGIITEGEFARLWNILLDAINGIDIGMRVSFGKQKAKNEGKPSTRARLKMPCEHEFTSHQLRHTFATNCDAKGISMRVIQYLMGHATPEMTLRYTHLSDVAMEDARAKLNSHPAVKKNAGKHNSNKSGQRVDSGAGKTA